MKKICIFLVSFFLLLLSSCSSSTRTTPYTVTVNNTVFTVEPEAGTISDGVNTFGYSITGDYQSYKIEIIYPDGSTYWQSVQGDGTGSSATGGWSSDYNASRYVDGDTLCYVLEQEAVPQQPKNKNYLVILIVLAIGLINLFSPRTAWYLSFGWRLKDAEPSTAALVVGRCSGGILLVVAIILLIV